jgi:LysM repeat protein
MNIYITDLETGEILKFPMLPVSVGISAGTSFYSYQIINTGEVKIPHGENLLTFSWNGILPGELRKNDTYVKTWLSPQEIQSVWKNYRAKKKKLRLLITETPINYNVYLDNFSVAYSGGFGDFNYSINFVQAKDLKVYPSGSGGESSSTADTVENKPLGDERPEPPPAKTYTVVNGDSMWAIAQKMMGDGSRYDDLYKANQTMLDGWTTDSRHTKYMIYPGQILTIPD